MPGPDKSYWKGRFLSGTFQYNEDTTTVSFLVCIEAPERFKDRIVQVTFTHEVTLNTFGGEALGAISRFGELLPEEMGDTPHNEGV